MDPSLLTSTSSRPLKLRLRSDLEVRRQRFQGRDYWIIKDPLRLKYFRFEEEEHWLLSQLDGGISLDELQLRFESQFVPQRVTIRELHQLLALGHQSGILVADQSGQGKILLERKGKLRSKRRWMMLAELLSLRFRGIDPDRFLGWLNGYAGWLFSWPAMVASVGIGLAALLLVASHFAEFCARLPSSTEFFGPSNWLALAATLAGVKILHEFGHGLACKRFGGECHEMGVLLLCFTPCLYCDVTDSWMIPSKWRRAAIGAAGMYVELWLAAIATLLWWYSTPGLLHHLCLNVMFVGSVSTLVFNANPLMRYDGYYILADLVEIPNLRTKAASLLRRWVSRWLFNTRSRSEPFLPARRQWLLVCYAIASGIYRWMITAAILAFLYNLSEPYGFKIVGQLLAVIAVAGLILMPLYSAARFLTQVWRWERSDMHFSRGMIKLVAIATIAVALLCIPLPYYVRCALRVQPAEPAMVYVEVPGQLAEILVHPGESVAAGAPLLRLRNLDLELTAAQLATQCDAQAGKVRALRHRSLRDDTALAEVAQAEEALAAFQEELARRREQLDRLTIVAPRAGVVMAPPRRSQESGATDQLRAWQGHPLEPQNVGARLETSDLVCTIGDPSQWEVVLAFDGHDSDYVQPGQRVDLLIAQQPGQRRSSKLHAVSRRDMELTPAAMSAKSGGELLTTTDAQGRERPTFVSYEAAAHFEDPTGSLANGGGGLARIHAGYQTLAARGWRWLQRTFHFDM